MEAARFQFTFTAGPSLKELIGRAQQILFAGDKRALRLENVIGAALEFYVSRHCPKERAARREARRKNIPTPPPNPNSRRVPAALRDEVLARDKYECSYVSATGVACRSRMDLEIDHVVPVARGGLTVKSNLRVLCRAHNLAHAVESFGEKFIADKISGRRQ